MRLDAEALLAELGWLRRLARSLVGSVGADEDIVQETWLAASRVEGGVSRPWLVVTLRQLAARWHRTESRLRGRERAAARPEGVDTEALVEANELLRRVLGELGHVEEPFRTALFLIYQQGLTIQEAAVRTGVREDTLRAQRREGIARLRRRLDAGEMRSSDWRATLGAAFGTPVAGLCKSGAAMGGAAGSMTVLGTSLMTWKFTAAALAAGLAIGFVLLRGGGVVDRVGVERTVESGPDAALEMAQLAEPGSKSGDRLEAVAQEAPRSHDPAPAAPAGARLFVVDAAGAALAGARAVWIPGEGSLIEIELGPDGTGVLPPEGRVTASCAEYFPAFADIDAAGEDLTLVLNPLVSLRGRVVVDGAPPTRPIWIVRLGWGEHLGLSGRHYIKMRQLAELRGLGIATGTEGGTIAWGTRAQTITAPDGAFAFPGVSPLESGALTFPSSFRIAPEDSPVNPGWPTFMHGAGDNDLVIHLVQLPIVQGHLVWADDGTPLEGEFYVQYGGPPANPPHPVSRAVRIWDDGRFEIGVVGVDLEEDFGDSITLPIEMELLATNGLARERYLRIDLAGKTLPLDVGVLEIERADTLYVHVEGRGGEPVEGAVVAFDRMGAWPTGSSGDVMLVPDGAADLLVFAAGYAPRHVSIAGVATTQDEPLTVRLDPGSTLCIATRENVSLSLQIELPRGAMLHGRENDGSGYEWISDFRHDIYPDSSPFRSLTRGPGGAWIFTVGCVGVPFTLGPLRPGAVIDVALVDDTGKEVARERVKIPLAPGTTDVDLRRP